MHRSCCVSEVIDALLTFRRNLADPGFLREHFYTSDHSKFVESTYAYWIRLELDPEPGRYLEVFSQIAPSWLMNQVQITLNEKIIQNLPREFSRLVKVPSNIRPEDSVRESLTQKEHAIKEGLPASIPYASYYSIVNRLIKTVDPSMDAPPQEEEFAALFNHLNRNTMMKARSRHPEVWEELRGHYIFDTRGTGFGKTFAMGLAERGFVKEGSHFIDLGSGIGTMVVAVNRYTKAYATGVERHRGLMQLTKAMIRRLTRKHSIDPRRIEFKTGDFFDLEIVDLSRYDVFYVYSPIGKWEVDIDDVIDRMRVGAILAMNKNPCRNSDSVEKMEDLAGLACFQKVATHGSQCAR